MRKHFMSTGRESMLHFTAVPLRNGQVCQSFCQPLPAINLEAFGIVRLGSSDTATDYVTGGTGIIKQRVKQHCVI